MLTFATYYRGTQHTTAAHLRHLPMPKDTHCTQVHRTGSSSRIWSNTSSIKSVVLTAIPSNADSCTSHRQLNGYTLTTHSRTAAISQIQSPTHTLQATTIATPAHMTAAPNKITACMQATCRYACYDKQGTLT